MDISPLPEPIPTGPLEVEPPPLNGYPTRAERREGADPAAVRIGPVDFGDEKHEDPR
jgi:hypothetical protein